MNEFWKDIKGFEGLYQVSNKGRVNSLDRYVKYSNGHYQKLKGRILKPAVLKNGYLAVALSKNSKIKTFFIHKLVAISFINHTPSNYNEVVDHINNNPLDNIVENLQIISHRKNTSKDKKGYSSKYVGVCWHKTKNKWYSSISINGKRKHLGSFENEYDAHLAYQKELKKIR